MAELTIGVAIGVVCSAVLWPAWLRLRNRASIWTWMINRCPYWWVVWAEPLKDLFWRFAYMRRNRLICRVCERSVSTVTSSWYGVERRDGILATVGECWRCRRD
jgi:hypothetical protein